MKIFGCGDIFVAKRLPAGGYEGFEQIQSLIKAHDACFGNLETTIHENEGYPSKFPGGGYAMASPKCLKDLRTYGFNVLNIANNHTLDYSHKGLEATIRHLNEADMLYFGAGINLADAAGPAGGMIPGRPGVNPLRRIEYYQLVPELYEQLQNIADATGMNDGHKWSIANGYREETELFLREMKFVKGEQSGRITHPLKEDLDRIKTAIKEASIQADCIVVSFHSHQMNGVNTKPAEFIREFCHECIDAGAHIIFGHGAHELRGLEMYKDCPIFYGLGDFIFHNEMQEAMPKEFYEKVGVNPELYDYVGIAMDTRSKGRTRGLQADSRAWETIAASISFENGKVTGVKAYPVSLGFGCGRSQLGWPSIDDTGNILKYFCDLSKEYGTNINDSGIVIMENML